MRYNARSLWLLCGTILSAIFLQNLAAAPDPPEARIATAADLFGGTDTLGGAGDLLLRNDIIEAIISNVGASADLNVPFTGTSGPSGGLIIDLGLRGKDNDQLNEIFQVVNLDGNSPIVYVDGRLFGDTVPVRISPPGSDPASITIRGVVIFGSVSGPSNPTIIAETTYSVRSGDNFISMRTDVTNRNPVAVPIFHVADAKLFSGRNFLPFAPFPGRGFIQPPLNLANPLPSVGVFPFVSFPGSINSNDGVFNVAAFQTGKSGAAGAVSYTLAPNALASPMLGVNSSLVSGLGSLIPAQNIASGQTVSYIRKLIVADRNDVQAGARTAFSLLGLPAVTLSGRVVDSSGKPVNKASVSAINLRNSPGALQPYVQGLVTPIDNNADGVFDGFQGPFTGGEAYPLNQSLTDADGNFSLSLPFFAAIPHSYNLEIRSANRDRSTVGPLVATPAGISFNGSPLPANFTVTLNTLGKVRYEVRLFNTPQPKPRSRGEHSSRPVAAKLTFVGMDRTRNPNFGASIVDYADFPGLARSLAEVAQGKDPITPARDSQLNEVFGGSPTFNVVVDADGVGEVDLAPGRYLVYASKGLEYSIDVASIDVREGQASNVRLFLSKVLQTEGFISADFHVHSGKSFDSSVPPEDRLVSVLAEGVEVVVPSDHDFVSDFAPLIAAKGLTDQLVSVGGVEVTGTLPVPPGPLTRNIDAFPQGMGHMNVFPVKPRPGARRNGAPSDEFITPAMAIDRSRALDALSVDPDSANIVQIRDAVMEQRDRTIVQLNHPRAGLVGLTAIGLFRTLAGTGYNPTQPLTSFPNSLLLTLVSPYGTGTTSLSFDSMELLNGGSLNDFRDYLAVRADWFSLLGQGYFLTGTGVSDSHQIALESVGFARSFVQMKNDSVRKFDEAEFVQNIKQMKVTGTSGPFISFRVLGRGDATLGEKTTSVRNGVTLDIKVSAAPWIPVDEVRIFANGRLVTTLPVTENPEPTVDFPRNFPVDRFNKKINVTGLSQDTYFVVEAGITIDRNGNPADRQRMALMNTVEPDIVPIAFTNPIFVDADIDRIFTPPGLPGAVNQSLTLRIQP